MAANVNPRKRQRSSALGRFAPNDLRATHRVATSEIARVGKAPASATTGICFTVIGQIGKSHKKAREIVRWHVCGYPTSPREMKAMESGMAYMPAQAADGVRQRILQGLASDASVKLRHTDFNHPKAVIGGMLDFLNDARNQNERIRFRVYPGASTLEDMMAKKKLASVLDALVDYKGEGAIHSVETRGINLIRSPGRNMGPVAVIEEVRRRGGKINPAEIMATKPGSASVKVTKGLKGRVRINRFAEPT